MRRNWIKLYVDQCLRGTMITELSAAERWIWVGLLLMAGDSNEEGLIFLRKNEKGGLIGYSESTISELLGVKVKEFHNATAKMIEYGKIKIDKNGVIEILKWSKYQSEYQRQKQYRDKESDKENCNSDCNQSNALDIERDKDIDEERDNNKEYPPEFESFWKHYPKKKEKKDAYFTWKTLTKKQQEEVIIAAEHYKMETDALQTKEEYIKFPKTFLNKKKEKWKDFLEPPTIKKRQTRQEIEDEKIDKWAEDKVKE